MSAVLNVYKPVGVTPLQAIDALREKLPEYKNERIGYAGRLDPMADGVLILLSGDETKKRYKYQNLDKTYRTRVLFGIETDTHDLLGLLSELKINTPRDIEKALPGAIKKITKLKSIPYPAYSSKTVSGKKLFAWAKEGNINKITIPRREINIYSAEISKIGLISTKKIYKYVSHTIPGIRGDFRQEEILAQWGRFYEQNPLEKLVFIDIQIDCSTGTYIRSLTHWLGEKLKCGAIAYSITRLRAGDYALENSIKVF